MNTYRADLHIHTVLSPCGDLEMSPRNIVAAAKACGLNMIAITDHNTTLHGPIVRKLAQPLGITVLYGAEVTTREEAHCLCLFNTDEQRLAFQEVIDTYLPNIPNVPKSFGYQVVVNENDEILYEEEKSLFSALKLNVNQVQAAVYEIGGIFIPAHIDRPMFSLFSQLGFVPPELKFDALEIFRTTNPESFRKKYKHLSECTLIKNSDAHLPSQIGQSFTAYRMESPTFDELKLALAGAEGRGLSLEF